MANSGNGGSLGLVVTEFGQIKELARQLEVHLGGSSDLCKHLAWQISTLTERTIDQFARLAVGEPSISLRHVRKRSAAGSSSYTTISSSSRSGTIVSTAYTSSGTASPHSSSSISTTMESVFVQLDNLDLELMEGTSWIIEADRNDAELARPIKKPRKTTEETLFKEMKMKRLGCLVQEFFGRPSANLNNEGGDDMNVLERWFTELGVSWVLQLDVGASPLVLGHPRVRIWIQALTRITETIHLTESFFHCFVGMHGISEEGEVDSGNRKQAAPSLDPLQFALFFQIVMAKMLIFVDVMFTKSISIHEPRNTYSIDLNNCLHIHTTLSEVLLGIRLQFHSSPPAEVEKIQKEIVSLLSAKQGKAFEATWNFMEETRTCALMSMEDSLAAETPQGSSYIHQATCSVMDHINFLLCNHSTVNELVSQAASLGKYVPQTAHGEAPPFISFITEMVSCHEEKLIAKSQLFQDEGLSLLFLLNNSNFIREQLQDSSCVAVDLAALISSITRKIEHYTESYIQVSWEPMLACLFNPIPTPLRLVRKYSPLSKFESEFQKIYTTQKLWNVQDPGLRKRLRKAIIEKIIPDYTKYIEDSKVTNPKFTPEELEEMLQELFEG